MFGDSGTVECSITNKLCPGRTCPFWLHGECLVSQIDVRDQDVVGWLDELRRRLARLDLDGHAAAPVEAR